VNLKESTSSNKYYLLGIFVVFVLAYLPLNSFLFALKNDMFTGYLAPKFIMGEAIHSNQLPLWNPYISFGLPFYGDMSASYWSPLTWLIASTTGYNPYTLTIEVLIYIMLSGAGMYYLSGLFSKNRYIRFIAAISYMCNGYIIGHLQHLNWLSGAAFLPWCLWTLEKLHRERNLKSLVLSALFFYLLISSSHPGISIGAIYFFAAYAITKLISDFKQNGKAGLLKTTKLYLLFIGLLLLLSLGLIAGYSDIIPYFDRNKAVDVSLTLNQNTDFKNWISSILPFATTSGDDFFKNDPAFRNLYMGLLVILLFFASLFNSKSKQQVFFLLSGSFFLLLSLGGIFKLYAAKLLPLLGHTRVNAEFRIFTLLCFIIAVVIFFDRLNTETENYLKKLKPYLIGLISVLSGLLVFSTINLLSGKDSVVQHLVNIRGNLLTRDTAKLILDKLSIYDTIVIQCVIQILILLFLIKAFEKNNLRRVCIIAAIDIVLATLLNLPFTGVGKVPVSTIAAIQKKSPPGIPVPPLRPVKNNDTIHTNEVKLIGEWSLYSKQPGAAKPALYPIKLINNYEYYRKAAIDTTLRITDMPFLYITNSITAIKPEKARDLEMKNIISYKTGELHLKITCDTSNFVVMLQNFYPHWYYKTKGRTFPVQKAGINFISVPLEKGENDVIIFFNPIKIKIALVISAFLFLLFICILLSPRINGFIFKGLQQ
jgi:hypothetical protein